MMINELFTMIYFTIIIDEYFIIIIIHQLIYYHYIYVIDYTPLNIIIG